MASAFSSAFSSAFDVDTGGGTYPYPLPKEFVPGGFDPKNRDDNSQKVKPTIDTEFDIDYINKYHSSVKVVWFAGDRIVYSYKKIKYVRSSDIDPANDVRINGELYHAQRNGYFNSFTVDASDFDKSSGWMISSKAILREANDLCHVLSLRRVFLLTDSGNFKIRFSSTGGTLGQTVNTGIAASTYMDGEPHIFTIRHGEGQNTVNLDIDNTYKANVGITDGFDIASDNSYYRTGWSESSDNNLDVLWSIATSEPVLDRFTTRSLLIRPYQLLKPQIDSFYFKAIAQAIEQASTYSYPLPKEFVPGYSTSKKPTIPVELDLNNPLTRGLSFFAIPQNGNFVNLANNLNSQIPTLPTGDATIERDVLVTDENKDKTYTVGTMPPPSTQTFATKATLHSENSGSIFNYIFGADGFYWSFTFVDNHFQANFGENVNYRRCDTETYTLGVPVSVMAVRYSGSMGSAGYFVVDGVKDTTYTSRSTSSILKTITEELVIGDRTDGLRWFDGEVEYVAIWDRDLSDDEAVSFQANPYQILKPQIETIIHLTPLAAATIESMRTIPGTGFVGNYSEGIIPGAGYATKLVAGGAPEQSIIPLVMHYLQQMRN